MSNRTTKLALCVAAIITGNVIAPASGKEAAAQGPERVIGSELQLFADRWLIDRLERAKLVLHSPVPREVVFEFDAPWEGSGSGYVTIMRDGERYRMYYRGGGEFAREHTCLAFSDDGVHWTRPSLGLFEFEGSKENNIIWTGAEKAYWESHNFSPFRDDNPGVPLEQRYKAVTLGRREVAGERRKVLLAFASPDGVRWQPLREEAIITGGSFDSHNVAFWDTVREQYVCYFRASRDGKRSIRRATSADFVTWSEPEWLDFGDTPLEHFYTNGIVPYFRAPQLYLAFPQRFVPERRTVGADNRPIDGVSDAVFMSSHDGLYWHRTFMEAFIRPGPDQRNWGGAHGNSCPSWGIVPTGEGEISIYWAEHYGNWPDDRESVPRLRRGALRTDGFASVHADYAGGEMVTRPVLFEGRNLVINYATSAVGWVKVELQNETGTPLPGFKLEETIEIFGDELARVVCWQGGSEVSKLAGRPVRIHFAMKDADLYSLRFRP
jgi:hypothetical protein